MISQVRVFFVTCCLYKILGLLSLGATIGDFWVEVSALRLEVTPRPQQTHSQRGQGHVETPGLHSFLVYCCGGLLGKSRPQEKADRGKTWVCILCSSQQFFC